MLLALALLAFVLLGITPLMGRTFLPSDETHQAEAVLVLSYPYWQRSHTTYRRLIVQPVSLVIALVGLFWTLQRVLA